MNSRHIFREYDIRGIVGSDIDTAFAIALGRSFGTYVIEQVPGARRVSVGRDVRLSSPELASALIEGIASTGLDVYDLGVCPTPLQYFSLFHLGLDGGVMVTGSHNPPEYNGFKISVGRETIFGEKIQSLKRILESGKWKKAEKAGQVSSYDIVTAYTVYVMKEFSPLAHPQFKRLKVVIDGGNGTAGAVIPGILKNIGCDVIPLYCEPDGSFPNHHPDPTVVEYISDMINMTRSASADIGVAYDGDGDRIGVVDRTGEIIWGDQLMIILSRDVLQRHPGAKIIGDVKCSQVMFDDISRHGGVPVMCKTGHSLVKQTMRTEGALLAGEFSGHIFLGDRYFGYDDALYTTLRLVEIMKRTGRDMVQLLSDVTKPVFSPEIRIDCPDDKKRPAVEKVSERILRYRKEGDAPVPIRDVITVDGARVVFEKGWGLIRSSNTQPVIIMRVEAADERSFNEYRAFLEREFGRALEEL